MASGNPGKKPSKTVVFPWRKALTISSPARIVQTEPAVQANGQHTGRITKDVRLQPKQASEGCLDAALVNATQRPQGLLRAVLHKGVGQAQTLDRQAG